jgi:hypothetical protein
MFSVKCGGSVDFHSGKEDAPRGSARGVFVAPSRGIEPATETDERMNESASLAGNSFVLI